MRWLIFQRSTKQAMSDMQPSKQLTYQISNIPSLPANADRRMRRLSSGIDTVARKIGTMYDDRMAETRWNILAATRAAHAQFVPVNRYA